MKQKHKASAIPLYGAAALWLLYGALLPLYRLWHFFIPAALSAALYWLLSKRFPGADYWVEEPAEPTGNEVLDEAIRQGREGVQHLRELNRRIEEPHITWQLDQLETITDRIFKQVRAHPELLPQIRRFMDYYLPTTIRLLESYCELDAGGANSCEVAESKAKIAGMLDTVLAAFQHQLDALFSARTMDINAEAAVLESMMQAEGLTDLKTTKSTGANTTAKERYHNG